MTSLYFVRHVQAMGNVRGVFQGHTDSEVSPLGERQLLTLTGYFRDIPLTRAYHSPLIRTTRTAQAAIGGRDIPLIPCPDLIEIYAGDFENRPWGELSERYPEEMSHWGPDYQNFRAVGGESYREVYERAVGALVRIAKENDGEVVLVATHGGVMRAIMTYVHYGDLQMLSVPDWVHNGSVTHLLYENGRFTVDFEDDRGFMPDELKN